MIARRIQVFGRVQGVFFRASTKTEADNLNLVGWVKNQPDQTVLIEVAGNDQSLNKLIKWCHEGPQFADVTSVSIEEIEPFDAKSFEIQYGN